MKKPQNLQANQRWEQEPKNKGYIMKIESYEMQMQSQHFLSVEYEKEISFSTMLRMPDLDKPEEEEADLSPVLLDEKQVDPLVDGRLRTIGEIIQSLMGMLEQKAQTIPVVSIHERYAEHESLSFSTTGHIKTDKGSFDIDLNFNMSRDFVIENRIDIFDSFDPLVINLCGDIPDLSQNSFSFDLDNDGESDQISKLGSGSGFLALDKNDDGIINQGSELFGTLTGDGFGELSEYDLDSNNWIDENDSIFDKLRIWLKNEDDNEKELVGLGEVGIGAIFLGSAQSEFTYKTSFNETLGEMKSCGIFLNENGSCGNISQIDFSSRNNHDDEKKESKKPLEQLLQA